ncbi:hypothetical protein HDU76_011511, partial [Blyttiomyces sp. JEL0837]
MNTQQGYAAPSDSMSTTVKDLAAEGRGDGKGSRFPAIPIYLVVLSLVVVALGIVTLPLGLIISDSSQTSISDLSHLVTRQAVDGIYEQIQTVIDQPQNLLKIVLASQQVQKSVTTNYNNLKGDVDLFLFFQTLINSTSYVNVISCVTRPNIFPGGNTNDPWPNSTYMVSFRQGNNFIRYYLDWTTGPNVHYSVWYPPYKMFVQDTKSENVAILLPKMIKTYMDMVAFPQSTMMQYSYTYTKDFLASAIDGAVWVPSITPSHVTYSCSVGFDNRNSLDPLLLSIK